MDKRQLIRISEFVREDLARMQKTKDLIRKRVMEALEIARKQSIDGKVLCYVSRLIPSSVSTKEFTIGLDIPIEEYIAEPIGIGDYIATVNLSDLSTVLMEVVEVQRGDILSLMGREPPLEVPPGDIHGILTPAQVKTQPIMAIKNGKTLSHVFIPIEPQSPVFRPKPEIIMKCLGLPEEGVLQGCMVTSRGRVMHNIPIRLPVGVFFQHILMVGTTGSGKTTWIKNMILSMMSDAGDVSVIIFDATGEYLQMILPRVEAARFDIDMEEEQAIMSSLYGDIKELDTIIVILPITHSIFESIERELKNRRMQYREKGETARDFGKLLGEFYLTQTIGNIVNALGGKMKNIKIRVSTRTFQKRVVVRKIGIRFTLVIDGREYRKRIIIFPWALKFSRLREDIKRLIPILTQQARYFFGWVIRKAEELIGRRYTTLRELRNDLARILGDKKERTEFGIITQVSPKTIENMLRGMNLLMESGLFDVRRAYRDPQGNRYHLEIVEPKDYGKLMARARNRVILVDLHMLAREEYIVVYRILNQVFGWKKRSYLRGKITHPVIIIIDEAHRYFPAAGFGESGSIELIEKQITYIARLGRARGLGLFFATHSPSDVSKVILQLTNTKIALRCEEDILEKVGIPKELREFLSNTKDRIAVIRSYAFRMHYVLCKTPIPLCGHYDITTLIKIQENRKQNTQY